MSRTSAGIRAALAAIMLVAVGVPILIVQHPPARPAQPPRLQLAPARVVPPAELPAVEPLKFVAMSPGDAEAYNATVPFSTNPNPAARPFRIAGTVEDRARATDCLATGVLYEAGDDAEAERSVAQVMLNRLRHPAFPKTVCGVVFEGAERSTGCQFSFTCDGSLDRWHPTEEQWTRARAIAAKALGGFVYKPVGYSTHYHTTWVVPYWQSSLDKVAKVGSHLFFRWTGWWGTPGAFTRQVQVGEPVEAKLAALSAAHHLGYSSAQADAALTQAALLLGHPVAPLATDPDTFLTALDPQQSAESYEALALSACGMRVKCRVMGWTNPGAAGQTLPLTAQQVAALSFSYLRDRQAGLERSLWDCAQFERPDRKQCLKRQLLVVDVAPAPTPTPTPAPGPEPLDGVRRLPATAPAKQPALVVKPPGTSPAATP